MRAITTPLHELSQFEEINEYLNKPFACAEVTGCVDSQKLHFIDGLGADFKYRIIVTYSDLRAKEIYEDYKFYDRNVTVYPAKDLIFYQADVHSNEIVRQRIRTMRRLLEGRPVTVVTTFAALMAPQIKPEIIKDHILEIDKHKPIDEAEIAEKLITMGYIRNYQVEGPGEFSVRGDIVDVFDLTEENPYRIELWGDEIQSIRSFDILSQRSLEKLESIEIYPASEIILDDKILHEGMDRIQEEADKRVEALRAGFKTKEAHQLKTQIEELREELFELKSMVNLESYIKYFYPDTVTMQEMFPKGKSCIFIDEPGRVQEHAWAVETEFKESMTHRAEVGYILPGQMDLLYSMDNCIARMGNGRRVLISALQMPKSQNLFMPEKSWDITARSIAPYNNSFESLVNDLKNYASKGYRVLILSGSRTRAKRIVDDLRDNLVTAFYSEDPGRVLKPGEIMTYYGRILKGFEYPAIKFAVIAESDIFTEHTKKRKKKKKSDFRGEKISSFSDLKIGDYVVHEDHGLGVYRGIEKIETDRVVRDYIKIEYGDGGNLYVLATGLGVIQKYASGGDDETTHKPKLNKLGGNEWTNTKKKVKSAVEEVAQDLVELYAKRQAAQGYQFSSDTVWQQEFEDAFPYQETDDQLSAIEDTKKDMESSMVMDRLVCGDVGFGKTEIAIRAAFKAVQDGKQVAVLVPTTILAQQHYNTFSERMRDFPVRVDLMSRFRTDAEQKKTITDLRKGLVDIVIGTHRLLSKDVKYKDLGLLIVDEEQRFGVTHKEKLKTLKENIDVLTLSATPIPRTLHMSLVGIREMSVLEEAPNDRMPIQTYVMEYNDELVREAIVRELSRNGQVYYVYNRVNTIADVAAQIQKLVPEANVAFAHGQMKESELERIMYDFIDGTIDVLVSTTIIETGLDIPNVNTMIIHDSDKMGLSQLYQLRGRVGRSNKTAYAFLMYKKDKMLKEVAEKRLSAIREFTDLGSGFKIAMRDLEIRGAGSLLGRKQSGHMQAVGYDLYCKMLGEAVKHKKNDVPDGDYTLDEINTSIDLDVSAFIPDNYILNEEQKLEIYKRIASLENQAECDEMKDELIDRFGEVPETAINLLRISLLRTRAHKLYILEIKGGNGTIEIKVSPAAKIDSGKIPGFVASFKGAMTFHSAAIPVFVYKYKWSANSQKAEMQLLADVEELIGKMEDMLIK
ncbi:transcription-repair coupling factor [Butyrivibrio sp. YAB3001]|uniref:transcription-repair coupling factor n=1 Tax=Butyrivibrio sp. YAB3001 TaxID=1520812 RepID=UPI0008F673EB|nr:transcription-repair coupling factor [Butyrivibrio sp. YAB3001]SFC94719.1 transcription-repair coupling factor (superfamily II helicase) [Butyrivibrio sp. YAB3001]